MRVAAATIGKQSNELTPDQALQMRLPARFAELQLDMPSHLVPLSRAARLIETGPAPRLAVTSWALAASWIAETNARRYDGVDAALQEGTQEMVKCCCSGASPPLLGEAGLQLTWGRRPKISFAQPHLSGTC